MNNKQNNTNNKSGRVLAVPSLCEFYPGICLTTEEKARKIFSQGSRRDSKYTHYQDTHTLQNTHMHTHMHTRTCTHITKQFKTATVQIKTNTVQDMKQKQAVPLQAWSGPEGSRKLRLPDYMTTAQDGGKVVSLYPPGNNPGTHFC
jgi:hypothetical protein